MTTNAPTLKPQIECAKPLFPQGLIQSAFDIAQEHGTVDGTGNRTKHTIKIAGANATITIWSEGPQSPERRTCIIIDGTYKRQPFHASVVYAYGLRGQEIGIESVEVTLNGKTDKVDQPNDARERNDQETEFRTVAGDETEAALSAMLTDALPIIAAEHARLDEQEILERASKLILAKREIDRSQSIMRRLAGGILGINATVKKITGHDLEHDPRDPSKLMGQNAADLGRFAGKAAISRDRTPLQRVELSVDDDLKVYIDEPLDVPQGQNTSLTVTINDQEGKLIATLDYAYPYLAQIPLLRSIGAYDGNVWREGRTEGNKSPWNTLRLHADLYNMTTIEETVRRVDAAIQAKLEDLVSTRSPQRATNPTASAEEATPPVEAPVAETVAPAETTTPPVSDEEAARVAAFLRGEGEL